jgi:putative RNA 2'-phosphotransferase
MNYVELSKAISHALRHAPEEYGLVLDAEGWVTVPDLLAALGRTRAKWSGVCEDDLAKMIAGSEKRRYEMVDRRIRALYGHSTEEWIAKDRRTPPAVLFHGTDAAAARTILAAGLKSMGRQYAHLSADRETAVQVGRRKAKSPAILIIRAEAAAATGVAFYEGNDSVWLADEVPAQFIAAE